MSRRTARALVVALLLALALSACVSMPSGGPVVETQAGGSSGTDNAVDINPRGPRSDDEPEDIVQGFLDAMQATPPITTSIAREFLTPEASDSWQPSETIVYDTASPPRGTQQVDVTLSGASRTDARGGWMGPLSPLESELEFKMSYDEGQWRISDLPNALIVPQSWFEPRFRQVSLYYFDPTGSILIPDPVFVPRGQQLASTLVNGLLTGPAPQLAEHELSFLPPQLRAVVSVPVTSTGVAQVDLTGDAEVAAPAPDQAERLVSQLAWTLRQDPTIERFRVSIDGRPVQLADNSSEFSVEHGHDFSPYVSGASTLLYGLQDGLMVSGEPDSVEPVTGPFGQPGYALRTVAPDPRGEQVAAVGESGSTLLLAPVKASADAAVTTLVDTGEDLLEPAWDFSGRVWTVDRRRTGSVVEYSRQGTMRELDVPGVTGSDVKDFLVSRDGSRLVAVVRDSADRDRMMVSRILTNGQGRVVGASPAVEVEEPDAFAGVIRDITWRSPTSVVVLHPVTRQLFQARTVAVDGAPTGLDAVDSTINRDVVSLIGTPVPNETIYALGEGALVNLSGARAATVPIPAGITSLDYAG